MVAMHDDGARATVSDDLVRSHREDWNTFTRFVTYGVVAHVILLALMAFFLL